MGDEKDRHREGGATASSEQNRGRGDHIPGQGAFTVMDAMRCVLAVVVAFAHAWYLLIEDYRGQASIAASAGYFLAGYAHAMCLDHRPTSEQQRLMCCARTSPARLIGLCS